MYLLMLPAEKLLPRKMVAIWGFVMSLGCEEWAM